MSRIGKSIDREHRSVIAQGWDELGRGVDRNGEGLLVSIGFLFWSVKNILKLDRGDCKTLQIYKITELHILNE